MMRSALLMLRFFNLVGERLHLGNGMTKHLTIRIPLFELSVLIYHVTIANYRGKKVDEEGIIL